MSYQSKFPSKRMQVHLISPSSSLSLKNTNSFYRNEHDISISRVFQCCNSRFGFQHVWLFVFVGNLTIQISQFHPKIDERIVNSMNYKPRC